MTRPYDFLCIPASVADATAVNPNGIKTLLADGLITFNINGNPVFINRPSNLPRNPPDCTILDNWVIDNLISAEQWFAKALRRFETCLLVNHNLWEKSVSSSPIILDDNLQTTSVSFFIANQVPTFTITETNTYFPVVTLSTQDNSKLLIVVIILNYLELIK